MPKDAAHQQIQKSLFYVTGPGNRQIESAARKVVVLMIRTCLPSPNRFQVWVLFALMFHADNLEYIIFTSIWVNYYMSDFCYRMRKSTPRRFIWLLQNILWMSVDIFTLNFLDGESLTWGKQWTAEEQRSLTKAFVNLLWNTVTLYLNTVMYEYNTILICLINLTLCSLISWSICVSIIIFWKTSIS